MLPGKQSWLPPCECPRLQKLSLIGVDTLEKLERTSPFEGAEEAPNAAISKRALSESQISEPSRDWPLTEKSSTRSSDYHSACETLVEGCAPASSISPAGSSSLSSRDPNGRILYRISADSFEFLPVSSTGMDDRLSLPCIEESTEEDSKMSLSHPSQRTHPGIEGQTRDDDYFCVLEEFLSKSSCKLQLLPERLREEPRMRYAADDKGAKVIIVFYSISSFEEHHHVFERLEQSKQIPKLLTVIQPRRNYCFLVFECGEYSLAERMKKGNLNAFEKRSILLKILEVLSDLHERGIVHGNLNPFNIVYFKEDFSWKLLCPEIGACTSNGEQILCASMRRMSSYTAPEILQAATNGESYISLCCSFDMWSYGMIAFKLITGKRLYRSESPRRVPEIEILLSGRRSKRFNLIHNGQARDLIRRLLSPDPSSRPTAETVLNDEFFRGPDDSAKRDNAMRRILSRLASLDRRGKQITDLVMETRTETRAEHISVGITLEYFRRRSDPSDPFYLREGSEVFTIRDRCLLQDKAAHLLKIGQSYRLRVTLTDRHGLLLRVKNVDKIAVSASNCIPQNLLVYTETVNSGKHEVCALLKLGDLECDKLDTRGPYYGDLHQKYVALAIAITFSLADDGCPQCITEEIWCRMVSARCPLILARLLRMFNKQWRRLPQPMRYAVLGCIKVAKSCWFP